MRIPLFLSAILIATAAHAAPRTIAVSYFDNTSNDAALDPLRKGLADMLITDLSNVTSLRIVEREKLEAVVREIKLGKTAYFDPKTAQKLGRGLGAEFVLTGSYLLAGEELRVDVRVVKVESGEVVAADKAQGQKVDFFDIEKELVDVLLRSLDLKLERAEKRAVSKKQTESFEAVQKYSNGLDARDRGDEEKAAEAFRAALEADPDYQAAQTAMGRLKVILQRADAANSEELKELEAKSRTPEFAKWLQDLLQKIGYAMDTSKMRQRITVLRFIVERDLKPVVHYGETTTVAVEPTALYAFAGLYNNEPDFVELVPPVYEYLVRKYPQDPSFSGFSATLPFLEQTIAKVRATRQKVEALKAEEDKGALLVTEEVSKSKDEPCRKLSAELWDLTASLRLLGEATHDTARIDAYATKFLDGWMARREQLCATEQARKISNPQLDGIRFQVSMAMATNGDKARSEAWWGKLENPATFASSRDSTTTVLQMRQPIYETRAEARSLLELVGKKSRK